MGNQYYIIIIMTAIPKQFERVIYCSSRSLIIFAFIIRPHTTSHPPSMVVQDKDKSPGMPFLLISL